MNNKFIIITPSYNNETSIEYNLASVLNQTYTNWEMIYINDCSTDKTGELVDKITKDDKRIRVIHNEVNKGAMYNYFEIGLSYVPDGSIVVHLDGDDWLFDEYVLEKLNNFYNNKKCLMTYGGCVIYTGGNTYRLPNPQNSPAPDIIHKSKNYRRDEWRYSVLRTYKVEILRAIRKDDLIDKRTNEYYWHASDLSFQYPTLEMCGEDRIGVLDFNAYVYNATPSQSIRTREREDSSNSVEIETEIRNKRKYNRFEYGQPITKLPQINIIGYQYDVDNLPTNFSIVYNRTDGDYDVTIITDFELGNYINNPIDYKSPVIADLHESREYPTMNDIYNLVYANSDKFKLILTHDDTLLTLPNSKLRFIMWDTFLYGYHRTEMGMREHPIGLINEKLSKTNKHKTISCVSSNKGFLPGHKIRLDILNYITSTRNNIDMYGSGFNFIKSKMDALIDYKFSIVIENTTLDGFITEKLNDCLLTKTIPIYYGPSNVGKYYNIDSMYIFNTLDELDDILNEIDMDPIGCYNKKKLFIDDAQNTAIDNVLTIDNWFDRYIKSIL